MTSGLAEQVRPVEAVEALPGSALGAPSARRVSLPAGLLRWLLTGLTVILAAAALAGLGWGFMSTAAPVSVSVDGMTVKVLTHQHTVGELLAEMQVVLIPEDRVSPGLDATLTADSAIVIQRARPVVIQGDSRQRLIRTHTTTVADLFAEAGISVGPHDELTLAGRSATVDDALPAVALAGGRSLPGVPSVYPWRGTTVAPLEISLRRAAALVIDGAGLDGTLWTTASTIGEALNQAGVVVYEGDLVTPGEAEPVITGQHVVCLLYTSPSPRDRTRSRMPSSA